MRPPHHRCTLFAILSVLSSSLIGADRVDFNRDIRPLISNNCLACHGPDENERAAGLRLDTEDGSREDLGGYAAVVPGKPAKSELLSRLVEDDEALRMPPEGKGRRLNRKEIAIVRQWIEQGGDYDRHWSYESPQRPTPPHVNQISWVHNPIDAFVLARLEQQGLTPSKKADRFSIARRVAIDLTGLPPTWEQAVTFVHSKDKDAYEQYVDSLLSSSAFGERWARVWLDLARYADSAGYADDPQRTIWAYRDYVIRSLNENKPFDQFTIEQIAGDLLSDPTDEQLIATAFHRNTMTNNEGGTNDEEFRNVAIVDRVNTTMAVWMGTTMACAQCHTHKYDPITQEEYFQFFAFFNSTEDRDQKDERPVLEVWSDAQRHQKSTLEERQAKLEKSYLTSSAEYLKERENWISSKPKPPLFQSLWPTSVKANHRKLGVEDDGWILAETEKNDNDRYTLEFPINGKTITALKLEIAPQQESNFVLTQLKAEFVPSRSSKEHKAKAKQLNFTTATADYEQSGFPASSVILKKVNKSKGWAVGGQTGKPHQITLYLDDAMDLQDGLLRVELDQSSVHKKHLLDRFRLSYSADPHAASWDDASSQVIEILLSNKTQLDDAELKELDKFYRRLSPLLAPIRRERKEVRAKLSSLTPTTTVPVMRELADDKRRKTMVQLRGNYQSTAEEVSEGTPKAFHSLEYNDRPTRLDLAHWLVSDQNPLTSRVIANRHWEQLFGTGIVQTSEEFGSQGELPSHPELLDWLAVELRDSGWDIKAFLKLIVMSATYQQSSVTSQEDFERDPANRLLSRGPRFRLSAEMVRDQALFVSGLLSDKMYGPPVNPPQPSLGLKAAFGSQTDWKTSNGEDRYRRGLYTMWRRSSPYPSMAQFDAPNREVCTVRRIRTNTPLQALVTLNDPVYVETAQALARKLIDASDDPEQRIRIAFRACLIRDPLPEEKTRLIELVRNAQAVYRDDQQAAAEMATNPIGDLPDGGNTSEYAAWTVMCNVLLNLDETLMKR